jgi:hypothetical protein
LLTRVRDRDCKQMLMPSLSAALLLANDDDCTKLHALCWSLASLNDNVVEVCTQLARFASCVNSCAWFSLARSLVCVRSVRR